MGLFSKNKRQENGLIHIHNLINNSFKNVQKDTAYILSWLNHLHQKNTQQEGLIQDLHKKHSGQEQLINELLEQNQKHQRQTSQLKEELNYIPKSKEEIRKIVDEYYSFEHIQSRIKALHHRLEELSQNHMDLHNSHRKLHQQHEEIHPKIEELRAKIEHPLQIPPSDVHELTKRLEKLEQKKASIKEKIIKRITKNSKDYIRSIILSYIKKYSKITALQLKEMVVEEQGLCSKSSFYRLLEELEEDPEIGVIKKGKEKHYIAKMTNKNY